MTVNAVGKNDNSYLNTVVKNTALGAAAGYSLKYLWPVNKQEVDINSRRFINLGRKIANETKREKFEVLPQRTPAQDEFIKLAKSKEKTLFSFKSLSNIVKRLGGEDSANGKELRSIVRDVNKSANRVSRRLYSAYKIMLKNRRPAIPFLVAGAGVGFISGIMKNIVKIDV